MPKSELEKKEARKIAQRKYREKQKLVSLGEPKKIEEIRLIKQEHDELKARIKDLEDKLERLGRS